MIEDTLRKFLWQVCLAYQDDVNIGTQTPKEHAKAMDEILQALASKRLRLKITKCSFGRRSIETLGFRVSQRAITPNDLHVMKLQEFPTPRCGQSLLRFLGVVAFFGRWVERFAERTAPLYEMLKYTGWNKKKKKRVPIKAPDFAERWTQRQQVAFEDVRAALADPVHIVPPRTGARKRVVSDASNLGYGAVLLQFEEVAGQEGEWRPVAFIARKLTGGEPRYTTTEKEAGSFVFAIRKWHMLEGETFQVVTDNLALKLLMNLRLPQF
jgi:RNase H-like domain found in reverse transcriptase/Reverse transcriptase (RNA-dependent DNA polymerase)